MKIIHRIFCWLAGIIATLIFLAFTIFVGASFYFVYAHPLANALVYAAGKNPYFWFCEQAVYLLRGTKEDVLLMNRDPAYLASIAEIKDKKKAKKMFEFWLSRGADINAQHPLFGSTVLHSAVLNINAVEEVHFLLSYGANKDLRDRHAMTPLETVNMLEKRHHDKKNEQLIKMLGG